MFAFLLQDLITVRSSLTAEMVQSETAWLDCSAYQDLVFWFDLRFASPASVISVHYETAPVKDPTLFVDVISSFTLGATPVVDMRSALVDTATVPPASWLRWRLVGSSAPWEACFRIYVTANRIGPV